MKKPGKDHKEVYTLLSFRQADFEEAPVLAAIAEGAFAEDEKIYGSVSDEFASPEIHRHFIKHEHYFTILDDGNPIGGICAIDRGKNTFEIGIIYIDPESQNKGAGAQALIYLENRFPEIKRWILDTGYRSYRNHHFYEKMGYRVIGETRPEADGYYKFIFEKKI